MDKIEHCIDSDGDELWKLNGRYHREDGPAVIWDTGDKFWYQHGIKHRLNGPAVEWVNSDIEWWLDNIMYTFDEYCKELNLTPEHILELKLKYG